MTSPLKQRSLKVLQIIPSISAVYGGPSQMIRGFSHALARQGAEVTILTTDSNGDNGQAPLDVPLHYPVKQDGYTIRYFRCAPFRRYKFSLGLLSWLYCHADEFDIAHIHALFSPVSSLSATIARYCKLPYILRPLGTLDPADIQKKRYLKYLYAAVLERPNIAGAASLHFTSPQENEVSDKFGTRTPSVVIPLGVTEPKRLPNPNAVISEFSSSRYSKSLPSSIAPVLPLKIPIPTHEDIPVILFMSRIDPKKGLDLLIPALENLVANGQIFHFVLAGANPQDPAYEKSVCDRIQFSPISSCTTITGFVQGQQKQALLQRADLFVLPSYYENFGISVAEAMVTGTPVLISDQVHIHPNVQEADAGWICSCNEGDLTMKLLKALQDPNERHQRGVNAQSCALEKYSWSTIAQQTLNMYHTILEAEGFSHKAPKVI
ncbi:MAG: hormogonium polysaccharide biosynthesis glycosyltransferase HpsP [Cyanobacteria bacterium P01_F01_bin.150]